MPLTPETWLDQQIANSTLAGSGNISDIIQLTNGNIMLAWTQDNEVNEISLRAQIFDPLGNPLGETFRLNQPVANIYQTNIDMAATESGGFIAVYQQSGDGLNSTFLLWEEYDATGTLLSENTITSPPAVGDPSHYEPHIAVSGTTSTLTVYTEVQNNTSNIVGRIFDFASNSLGAEIPLFNTSTYNENFADVTVLENGNYVISAIRELADGGPQLKVSNAVAPAVAAIDGVSRYNVVFQIVGADGIVVKSTTIAGGEGLSLNSAASVTPLAEGGFVIGWVHRDLGDGFFQVYDTNGYLIGTNSTIGANGTFDIQGLTVSPLDDGGFALIFYDHETGQQGLKVQRYDADGVKIGNTHLITEGLVYAPTAILLGDGRMAVTWPDASGVIQMEILDSRDTANTAPAYEDGWQVGTIGNDTFTANEAATIVHGWNGDDKIYGSAGNKSVYGDEGNDLLLGLLGNESLFGGNGNDIIGGGAGSDTVHGNDGIDRLFGNDGDDFIFGEDGDDFLYGNKGNDELRGGNGNDKLYGQEGDDFLGGGAGDDELHGGIGKDDIRGGSGNDLIGGGAGNDFILGGAGLDRIYGGDENDVIGGGQDNDELYGGKGDDRLFGNDGVDVLYGGAGHDVLFGNKGDDELHGGTGNDSLDGQEGNDSLFGDNGQDLLAGRGGDDILYGGNGDDDLYGNQGNDTIYGEAGKDTLYGGNGNDILNGGSGNDILHGQGNTDTFVFDDGFGTDIITDFANDGLEKIDLSQLANITDFSDLMANHVNTTGTVVISDGSNSLTVLGYSHADMDVADFLF